MKFSSWGETTANLPGLQEHQNSTPFQVGHMSIWQRNRCCQSKALWCRSPLPARGGGGGGATRPPDLPISCPSPTGLVTPDTGVPKVTQSTLPSTPTSEDYLDELIWRRDTHRTLFAHFCRGGQKKKIIMIKERLPSSPELKNKWETPGKSGKKILVRTTNCFNSLWWRRINA